LRFSFPPQGTADEVSLWTARFVSPPKRIPLENEDLWLVNLEMERLAIADAASTGSGLYRDPDIFYPPTIINRQVVSPTLLSPPSTFYVHKITGPLPIAASLYTDADTFFVPKFSYQQFLTVSLVTDADTFYGPIVVIPPAASRVTDPDTFYTPVVTGPARLFPGLFTDPDTFGSPTQLDQHATIKHNRGKGRG